MPEQNSGDLDQFNEIGKNPITASILNAVPHALVGLVDRKIIFANNAVKTIFNIDPDKAIGQSTRMFYRSDQDFKRIAELLYPILEGKECFAQEFPCQTYDGREIICNVSAARVGSVLKNQTIVVMYEDVTAHKQIESEHVLFRNLIDQSTDAIFVINPDTGSFLDVNQRACDSLGYSKQELLTMTVLDIDSSFTADKFSAHIEQELKIKRQIILETKHQRKDGYQFFVEINSKLITIENKQYIISIARDISERKQAEAELKQSVVEWDRTFNSIEDLIFIQDLNNVIVKANRAFADFLKMPLAEIEGKKCYELLHKKQHVFPGCPAQLTKKEQLPHSVEINDPQINIPLFVTTSPIFDESGQMVGVLHIAQNISREKQAEKELKRKLRDLEIFRKSSVGREIKMLEMKQRIEELEQQIAINKQ